MKIINNDAYQAYNKLINGYDAKNIELGFDATVNAQLVSGAIGLATCGADNPFEPGTREAHLYYRIGYCYSMWRRNGIDAKVNRIRMLRAAVELAEMNIENPFEYEVEPVIEPSEDVVS